VDGQLHPSDPARIGPYRIFRVLGSGGMGRVYLGKSAGGRLVAVKVIRADLAADHEFRTRFRREVAAARRVSGLYTAMVVDADVDGSVPWLATAYVSGKSLADVVAGSGPLPADQLRELASGLAEGLDAIHDAGLVHRDLKPSNVLLAADGPRVIDFGISRAVEATSLTASGFVVGTPGYMSPEQAEGRKVGPASDMFSLGAVLMFAATGEAPFGSGSVAALIYRVVHAKPDLDGVSDEIRPLVGRCLSKDPADRPTAADILAEVGEAELAGESVPTAPPERPGSPEATEPVVPDESSRPSERSQPSQSGAASDDRPSTADAPIADALAADSPAAASPGVTNPAGRGAGRHRGQWAALEGVAGAIAVGVLIALSIPGASPPSPPVPGKSPSPVSPTRPVVYSAARYGFDKPDVVLADGTHVLVQNESGSVTEVDERTGALVRTISPRVTYSRDIADDGSHLWVDNYNSLNEYSVSSGKLIRSLSCPRITVCYPGVLLFADGSLWAATLNGYVGPSLDQMNPADGSLLATVPRQASGPQWVNAMAVDGSRIWIASVAVYLFLVSRGALGLVTTGRTASGQ
jgi:serine/threonine protein kinase